MAVGGAPRSAGTSGNLLDGDLPKQPQPDPKTCSDDNKICSGCCGLEHVIKGAGLGCPGCSLRGGCLGGGGKI